MYIFIMLVHIQLVNTQFELFLSFDSLCEMAMKVLQVSGENWCFSARDHNNLFLKSGSGLFTACLRGCMSLVEVPKMPHKLI